MTESHFIPLKDRAIIEISGEDRAKFLQGIISNDIEKVTSENAIYALILTPQGKFLFDVFITEFEGRFLIDCNKSQIESLIKRLSMYKLRADVEIKDVSDSYEAVALTGENVFKEVSDESEGKTRPFCKGIAYIDPRTKSMFARSIIARENNYQSFDATGFTKGEEAEYEELRISVCVPEGVKDLQSEDAFPLQFAMDEFNAIDFNKGCYVGQEVTARSKHRGNIRKSIFKIESDGELASGTDIKSGEKNVGKVLSSLGNVAIALLEKEAKNPTIDGKEIKLS